MSVKSAVKSAVKNAIISAVVAKALDIGKNIVVKALSDRKDKRDNRIKVDIK